MKKRKRKNLKKSTKWLIKTTISIGKAHTPIKTRHDRCYHILDTYIYPRLKRLKVEFIFIYPNSTLDHNLNALLDALESLLERI